MSTKVVKTVAEVKEYVNQWKKDGLSIGLVPTMGYLHEGHASLIKRAVAENDRVIVSDFVNPIQFGVGEDLETYPRDLQADTALCDSIGADIIFNPEPSEMYPEGFSTHVDVEGITEVLCGKTRPTHFRGVCTVVSKLFNISQADRAYFGQKDAQQLAVVRRFVRDLNFNIQIVGCPIIREEDGLAKSSRNTYLSPEEKKAALVLSRSLSMGRKMIEDGEKSAKAVRDAIVSSIEKEPLAKIDYVEIVGWDSLEDVDEISGPVLAAVAVYVGKTRLIDNFITE
ncbi:MAG: pantoate--beta-alanine ligase [Eubacterium sp.]|nr:pantoate--beta-alanine ligase [Eubacterium sp.]